MTIERAPNQIDTIIIHSCGSPNGSRFDTKYINWLHGKARLDQGLAPFSRKSKAIKNHASQYSHIGYHFVIWVNGVVDCGRALREVGQHTNGHNQKSIGICLIGSDKFSHQQWRALSDCITSLRRDLPNISQVVGHNQIDTSKTCPGFSVGEWLANNKRPLPSHTLTVEEVQHG